MDVLVVAAHPDDAEIGLGGTIARLTAAGLSVGIVDLTDGEPTPRGSRETRLAEAREAAKLLGVRERIFLDLPNRYLQDTPETRAKLAEVMRTHRPRVIFGLLGVDQHPDHIAACDLARHARFYAKLTKTNMTGKPYYPPLFFQYATSHLRRILKPAAIVDISGTFERKVAAVLAYRSQFGWREERMHEVLTTIAKFYGQKIGVRYGEPIFSPEEFPIWDPRSLLP